MRRVHYRGTLQDGTEFDSSHERDPLEFTLGEGMVIPGFEQAVAHLSVGERITVTIPPEEAYGEHHSKTPSSRCPARRFYEPPNGRPRDRPVAPDGRGHRGRRRGRATRRRRSTSTTRSPGRPCVFEIELVEVVAPA